MDYSEISAFSLRALVWIAENVSLIVATIALLISYQTYRWRISHARSAYSRSIVDEFWFQKIIAPNILDPARSFVDELLIEIDTIDNNKHALDLNDRSEMLEQLQKKLRHMSRIMERAALIDQELAKKFEIHLQSIEDILSMYIFDISSYRVASDYSSLVQLVSSFWTQIVTDMRNKHLDLF